MRTEVTDYTDELEWQREPENCDHPEGAIKEVIDSTGTVVTVHQTFMECQRCGVRVIEEEDDQDIMDVEEMTQAEEDDE